MSIALRCSRAVAAAISSTQLQTPLPWLLARALHPDHLQNLREVSCGSFRTFPLLFSSGPFANSFHAIHTSSSQLQPEAPSSSYPPSAPPPEPQNLASVNDFEPVIEIPLVPGTYFRLTAGSVAVRVEHVAGWSDVAILRGRAAAKSSWQLISNLNTGSVASSTLAGVRQAYEIRPPVAEGSRGVIGGGGGCDGQDDPTGLLHLTIPEKWISLDIQTAGSPVFVSKIVEADLWIATGGAPVTLGSVRALRVELDTSLTTDTEVNSIHTQSDTTCVVNSTSDVALGPHPRISSTRGGSSNGMKVSYDSGGTTSGSIMGGEVSGTSISITASGPVNVRRLVGGSMRVTVNRETGMPSSVPAATPLAAHATLGVERPEATVGHAAVMSEDQPGVQLGAVYGGRLHVSTGGGAVRIGTLDCSTSRIGGQDGALAATCSGFAVSNGADRAGSGSAYSPSAAFSGASGGFGGSGAEVLSHGGAINLDGLEGDAAVDSGGGPVKVLIQPGLRSARFASHGGPVDMALAPSVALRLLEIRGAAAVQVEPDLQRHMELLLPSPQALATAAGAVATMSDKECAASGRSGSGGDGSGMSRSSSDGGGGSSGGDAAGDRASGHLTAKVTADTEGRSEVGRGTGQRAGDAVLMVGAGGGIVTIRRMGWMDALRAKLEQPSRQRNKEMYTSPPQT